MKFPVLAGQADLLLGQAISGHSSSHYGLTMAFPPHVGPEHIVFGIRAVVSGYAALRMRFFGSAESGFFQEIEPSHKHELAIEFHDISDASAQRQYLYTRSVLCRDAAEWDWGNRGVYRFIVLKASKDKYQLMISLQQVAVDRTSIALIIDALRSSVLCAAQGHAPATPSDRYESAVTEALLSPAAEAAASRHWEREFDVPDEAFSHSIVIPPARPRTHQAAIVGEGYIKLKQSAALGAWGPSALFLNRLITAWARHQPRTTLVDVFYTIRSANLANQVGMFSTIRPIVLDLSVPAWRDRLAGQVIRAAAHQQVDSLELRNLELRHGVPRRPFPVFNYVDSSASEPGSRDKKAEDAPTTAFSAPYTLVRPISVKVRDTGDAFTVYLQTNATQFSDAESTHLLSQLVGQ